MSQSLNHQLALGLSSAGSFHSGSAWEGHAAPQLPSVAQHCLWPLVMYTGLWLLGEAAPLLLPTWESSSGALSN